MMIRLTVLGASMVLLGTLGLAPAAQAQRGTVLEDQSFQAPSLGAPLRFSVYLPPGYAVENRSYLTVYLLHGYGGDHTDWVRLGNAAFNADSLIAEGVIPPVILVMPDGRNSWYVNSDPASGFGAYEAAIVEDLVSHIESSYRTIPSRRGRMIAGLSMGGYGAIHLAFKYPERFGAAASLSGAHPREEPPREDLYAPAFGDPFDPARWEEENPFRWIGSVKEKGLRVPVYLTVGDDDAAWLYQGSVDFYTALKGEELPAELRITDGAHSWGVWDAGVVEALVFFGQVFRSRYR